MTQLDMSPAGRSHQDQSLPRAALGNQQACNQLLSNYREPLRRLVAAHLDHRLQQRIDPSDVVQETYLEASERLSEYLQNPTLPFYMWLRFLTFQKLRILSRHHRQQKRDWHREVAIEDFPAADSGVLAVVLIAHEPSASAAAMSVECHDQLISAIDSLPPIDHEILTLRYVDQLSNVEAANALGIQEIAARKRHVRAMRRLKTTLTDLAIQREHELRSKPRQPR